VRRFSTETADVVGNVREFKEIVPSETIKVLGSFGKA